MPDDATTPLPIGFLTDNTGTPSSMRLMCVISLGAAVVFGALVVLGKAGPDGFAMATAFLVVAFGGKVSQAAVGK